MSRFTDALNTVLPSKMNGLFTEGYDDTFDENDESYMQDTGSVGEEGCNGATCEDDEDVDTNDVTDLQNDDDDFDPDDLSDEELSALDAELSGNAMGSVIGDGENEVDLSPEEEIQADDMMSVAATTMLVNDELNVDEKAEFAQTQGETAVIEGFMTETDVNEIALESGLVQEGKYTNKMIIRLDAESKKKQLYALAVNVSAAAHHDPDYVKLKKVMKMRKILRAKLDRKYHAEATKRMRIYFNRLKKSKAPALSKIGHKFSK